MYTTEEIQIMLCRVHGS